MKDRLALNIIEEAERSGALKPGQTVVEATSGNTGIGLAMVCAQKGYPLVVTMADSFSIERRKLMRMLGAKVVLTPRAQKGFGMYQKAVELAEANGWFLARQFETKANAAIHEATTAREIIDDFAGSRLDYFVTGYGTGGTVAGVGARAAQGAAGDGASCSASRPTRSWSAAARRRSATPDGAPAVEPSGLRAASDPGLDAGLHPRRAAGGDRRQALRRGGADRRRRGHRMGEGAGAEGRHLHRHLRRRHLRRRATGRRAGAGRLGDPLHAARHRRALHDDAAVRRHRGRDGRGGDGAVALDAAAASSRRMTAPQTDAGARRTVGALPEETLDPERLERGAGRCRTGSSTTRSPICATSATARSGRRCRRTCAPFSTRRCRASPTPLAEVYREVAETRDALSRWATSIRASGPGTWASSNFTGALGDFLAAIQGSNLGGGNHAAALMDQQVVDWCKEMVGFPASASGTLVSGGSMANIIGLTVARNVKAGIDVREHGVAAIAKPLRFYGSDQIHSCHRKAMEALGLGNRALRRIRPTPTSDRPRRARGPPSPRTGRRAFSRPA